MQRRNFIKNTLAGSIALSGITNNMKLFAAEGMLSKRPKLKDRLWIWGQTAGSHHGATNPYHLPGKNLMDPAEGCKYLGIERCCRVAMGGYGPVPPFNEEAEKLKDLKEVVWSAVGDSSWKQNNNKGSDIDAVLQVADTYPNITGAVLDDFFHNAGPGKSLGRLSVEGIRSMRDQLHQFNKRSLDLWVVWYTHQLDWNVADYLQLFDVITLWEWKGSNLKGIDKNIEEFIRRTPGKRRFAGCYLWNYGETKPMEMDLMKYQLDRFHHWIQQGDIEGIVFCSNCVEDIGLETVAYTRKWITEVGNERVK